MLIEHDTGRQPSDKHQAHREKLNYLILSKHPQKGTTASSKLDEIMYRVAYTTSTLDKVIRGVVTLYLVGHNEHVIQRSPSL